MRRFLPLSRSISYIRPDADDTDGGWLDQDGNPTLYSAIDDAIPKLSHSTVASGVTTYVATSVVTNTFKPADGSLLVVCIVGTPNALAPPAPYPTVSGGGLTWTRQAWFQNTGGTDYEGWSAIYTAQVATGASMAVTVSTTQTVEYLICSVVEVIGAKSVATRLETGGQSRSGAWSGTLNATPLPGSLVIGSILGNSAPVIYTGGSWIESFRYQAGSNNLLVSVSQYGATASVAFDALNANYRWAATFIEITSADADYIVSPKKPINEVCTIRLSNPSVTPAQPMTVRYRAQKVGVVGSMELRVRLLQGVTQIASWTESNVPATVTQYERTLSGGEFAAITDFNDLYLEIRANIS